MILGWFKGTFFWFWVLGIGKTPPHVGKNSQIIPYFFFERVPHLSRDQPGTPLKVLTFNLIKISARLLNFTNWCCQRQSWWICVDLSFYWSKNLSCWTLDCGPHSFATCFCFFSILSRKHASISQTILLSWKIFNSQTNLLVLCPVNSSQIASATCCDAVCVMVMLWCMLSDVWWYDAWWCVMLMLCCSMWLWCYDAWWCCDVWCMMLWRMVNGDAQQLAAKSLALRARACT